MILPARQARQVAAGTKTQHREPYAKIARLRRFTDEHGTPRTLRDPSSEIGARQLLTAKDRRGQDGEPIHLGIVTVTAITYQRLDHLTFTDARAEGFRTRDEFYTAWTEQWWNGQTRTCRTAPLVAVKHLVYDGDIPRLLTPAAQPRFTEHGYTHTLAAALPEEPEAVDVTDLDISWARAANERHLSAQQRRDAARTGTSRLRAA